MAGRSTDSRVDPPTSSGRADRSPGSALVEGGSELAVVDVPAVAEREDVQQPFLTVPVDDDAVVADPELVRIPVPERFKEVSRPVTSLTQLRLDSFADVAIESVQPVDGALGEANVGRSLQILKRDCLATSHLFTTDLDVLLGPLGQRRLDEHMSNCVPDEFALVEVVRMCVDVRLDVVLHLVGNLHVQCAHRVTRAV